MWYGLQLHRNVSLTWGGGGGLTFFGTIFIDFENPESFHFSLEGNVWPAVMVSDWDWRDLGTNSTACPDLVLWNGSEFCPHRLGPVE